MEMIDVLFIIGGVGLILVFAGIFFIVGRSDLEQKFQRIQNDLSPDLSYLAEAKKVIITNWRVTWPITMFLIGIILLVLSVLSIIIAGVFFHQPI